MATYTKEQLLQMGGKVVAPKTYTAEELKAMGGVEVGKKATPTESFKFPIEETKQDVLSKIKEYQSQAEKSKKTAYFASSPLGMVTNFGKELVKNVASSEVNLGNTISGIANTKNLEFYNKNISDLTTLNVNRLKQIKELENKGLDATSLKKQYNQTQSLIDENVNKVKETQGGVSKTTGQVAGEIGGVALDVLSAGTYGAGAKGLKTGQLATKTPIVKGVATAVSPELGQVSQQQAKGLFTKKGVANVLSGAGLGYASDVTQKLQNKEENPFTPGIGTVIGTTIPLISELSVTKNPFAGMEEKRANDIINKREQEIYNIENNYAKTRKSMDYSKDANAASRKRIASTDILADAVNDDGLIKTMQKGGAVEQYKKMTIDGAEDVVRKNLEKEGASIDVSKISDQLKKDIMSSGLEGKALKSALNNIDNEIEGLMLRADSSGKIPLTILQDAKISTTGGINYMTEPFVKSERKAIARAYKTLIEDNSKLNIKEINEELSKYYKDINLLESLDGLRVKGGKLGKYFSTISGNIIGGIAGNAIGGPFGSAVGTVVGGEVGGRIRGNILSKTLGGRTGAVAPKSTILEKAREYSNPFLPKAK